MALVGERGPSAATTRLALRLGLPCSATSARAPSGRPGSVQRSLAVRRVWEAQALLKALGHWRMIGDVVKEEACRPKTALGSVDDGLSHSIIARACCRAYWGHGCVSS